jgi:hypothetical protein
MHRKQYACCILNDDRLRYTIHDPNWQHGTAANGIAYMAKPACTITLALTICVLLYLLSSMQVE